MRTYLTLFFICISSVAIAEPPYTPPTLEGLYTNYEKALEKGKNRHAISHANQILQLFPDSPYTQDLLFQRARLSFESKEYETANEYIDAYIKRDETGKYLTKALEMKFAIAEAYHQGFRVRTFGLRPLPRIFTSRDECIELYDQILSTMPRHELAAQSLFNKGSYLLDCRDFKESLETYQTLLRRFPQHPLAIQSYIQIAKLYLDQMKYEYADPDLLELAQINQDRFSDQFPSEPLLKEGERYLNRMREVLADDFMKIAKYYLRVKKADSAGLYLSAILHRYPHSKSAKNALELIKKHNLSVASVITEELCQKIAESEPDVDETQPLEQ